ncbi:MAG: TIGR00730 family Rossman fold protein [Ideonella sp. MAG2]|nr:MAG: TIGR00730 family Rossman fold protein [Ideonella sp. MAG2]
MDEACGVNTTEPAKLSVCVYCGARSGAGPQWVQAAHRMGEAIAQRGWRLVYGGGNVGLMGAVADAALACGGEVVGVIPERLQTLEVAHKGLTQLVVVQTMHQRKQRMAELSQGFMALPGGIGTFEELFEAWTWRHLGYHQHPIGLLNTEGFFDGLLAFLAHTGKAGFTDDTQHAMLEVAQDADHLLERMTPGMKAATGSFQMI